MAQQLYSLWRKKEGGKWERVESCAPYPKATAVRVFQNRLLSAALAGGEYRFELRPVKDNGGI